MRPSPGRRGDPVWLPGVIRAFGVNTIEDPGWKLWGAGDFGAIWGVMAHHTGANNTSTDFIRYNPMLRDNQGRPQLSSQIHLSRAGVVTLVGAGIAWHAGKGSYPGIATNNANAVTIGIEAQGDGQTWPAVQMDAYHRTCAAICWYLGLPASRVIAHHEWAGQVQGKWDPGLNGKPMPMQPFRAQVQALIDAGPNTPQEGFLMALTDDEQRELLDKTREMHRELTQLLPSRSAYRHTDEPIDTLAGLTLNVDARVHEDWVHARAAEDGMDPAEWAAKNLGGKNR